MWEETNETQVPENNVISIQYDEPALRLVIEALWALPHSNIQAWNILKVHLSAYQTLQAVEEQGIDKVVEEIKKQKESKES